MYGVNFPLACRVLAVARWRMRAAGVALETAAPEAALGETSAGGQADAHVRHDSIDGREMMKITFWDVLSTVK